MVFMSRSTRPVSTINRATIGPLAKHHLNGVSLLRRVDSGSRIDDGWAKAQPAVVLILKRIRKQGHGYKSHPTDWEKPGIKPGPPWFTKHMLPLFVAVFLGYNQYWPDGFVFVFVVLCPGAPEGSTGSGSCIIAPQKTGLALSLFRQTGWSRESNLRPQVYKT